MNNTELYEQRLLVFIETEPQSGEYQQLLLNGDEFKRLSDTIGTKVQDPDLREDFETLQINLSDDLYKLPDLKSINA